MDEALDFWGKAKPRSNTRYHPAAYHMLDVAACAHVLLGEMPLLHRRLANLLDMEDPRSLLTGLIALHDAGKFSKQFQCRVPRLWPDALGPIADVTDGPRHDAAGLWL